ncbi:hypothetical protein [Stenotrophomonas maltophilia]|uniref:hypothetical protein n=1 Tax=Stenotrophomonas maltophilia TaxID=40324 RepID=UPI00066EA985|nr:hypothetical protein [Stenotrophomonas maltophilia]MBH1464010.1 hypothetical protein [Stenotrophomonas maltophilia]MBH1615797.1 hypothetical protein [Stenotrophomonas maltophilia]MBN5166790.1 hypothetical protein [Stenotrophomonas maltophilia]
MVMRLDRPNADQNTFIDKVVLERQAGCNAKFFSGIQNDWKARVQNYLAANGDPSVIQPWAAVQPHATKFHTLYLSPAVDSVQKPVLDTLRSRELQLCPICGEEGTPNTLDHHLPKQTYPELSITACNLVPMCDICQGNKLTSTVNTANERLFLHPYFDEFVDQQVYFLDIGTPYSSPTTMTLGPHPALEPEQASLVSRHLGELGIAERYTRFFKDEYMRLLRLSGRIRAKGLDLDEQIEMFRENALDKSVNSWHHVFYSGAIANAALMHYLRHGQLPMYR